MAGQSSLSNVQVAITVDDFVLWDGTPLPAGHSSLDVTRALAEALYRCGSERHLRVRTHIWHRYEPGQLGLLGRVAGGRPSPGQPHSSTRSTALDER